MRVIGGRLRGRTLAAPPKAVRPTRDAVRESMFNLLRHGGFANPPPPEAMRVLDLFAGSGALGIEALSRGAAWCLFLDSDAGARAAIRGNLDRLGLAGSARISRRDASRPGGSDGPRYDLAFVDPPYGAGLAEAALRGVGAWMRPGALAVVETAASESLTAGSWSEARRQVHGGTAIRILRLNDET